MLLFPLKPLDFQEHKNIGLDALRKRHSAVPDVLPLLIRGIRSILVQNRHSYMGAHRKQLQALLAVLGGLEIKQKRMRPLSPDLTYNLLPPNAIMGEYLLVRLADWVPLFNSGAC